MTEETFKMCFALLRQEYKHELKDFAQEEIHSRMKFWYSEFKDIPDEAFTDAIRRIVRTNKFFPKVSEIFETLQESVIPKVDHDVEFQKAIEAIKSNPIRTVYYTCQESGEFKHHTTSLTDVLKKLAPATARAVRHIGIDRMINLDDRVWVKKEFAEILEDVRSENINLIIRNGLSVSNMGGIGNEQRNIGDGE